MYSTLLALPYYTLLCPTLSASNRVAAGVDAVSVVREERLLARAPVYRVLVTTYNGQEWWGGTNGQVKSKKKDEDDNEDESESEDDTTGAKIQKKYIKTLKQKDPEFFEFLKVNF